MSRVQISEAIASLSKGEILILKTPQFGEVFWKVNLQKGTVYSPEDGNESLDSFIHRVQPGSGGGFGVRHFCGATGAGTPCPARGVS
jgi:hypothetical protein